MTGHKQEKVVAFVVPVRSSWALFRSGFSSNHSARRLSRQSGKCITASSQCVTSSKTPRR